MVGGDRGPSSDQIVAPGGIGTDGQSDGIGWTGRILALVIAYLGALAATPFIILLLLKALPVDLEIHRMILGFPIALLIFSSILSIPGFVLSKLCLWWLGVRSATGHAVAGAMTGLVALVILLVLAPRHLSLLLETPAAVNALVAGAGAGMVYWWIERAMTKDGRKRRDAQRSLGGQVECGETTK